jgi:hypothetical protein
MVWQGIAASCKNPGFSGVLCFSCELLRNDADYVEAVQREAMMRNGIYQKMVDMGEFTARLAIEERQRLYDRCRRALAAA